MENDKSAVDSFLGDLPNNDGDAVFEEGKSENLFQDDIIVNKEEKVEKEEDKPIPFHKDPKVLRFIEKEVEKRASAYQPKTEEEKFVASADDIDDVLVRIIGNDTPEKLSAVKDLKRVLIEREDKGAEKALQRLQAEREAEQRAEAEAEAEIQNGLEDIELNFNVDLTSNTVQARKSRNEFLTFVERIAPKDKDGEVRDYPDFEEAYKLFQERKKPDLNTKNRELASRGMTRSGDASNAPVSRDYSWKGVEKAISGMFK